MPPLPRTPIRTLLKLARTFLRPTPERDLDDEIRECVDSLTDAQIRSGLSPADACRVALLEIGGLAQVKEEMRGVHPWHEVDMFWRDIRFGSRALRRSPGFAAVVVLTLALGVGAGVTMFSVLQAVMWRALPYPNSDRLVAIEASFGPITDGGLSAAEFDRIRDSKAFSHVGVANAVDAFITVGDEMERVAAASATDDVLPLLGGFPLALGRPLRSATDVNVGAGSVSAVVISHRLWRRMFHSDPGIIGRHVEINNLDVEVVGVLPDDLRVWLPSTTGVAEQTDVWFPKRLDDLVEQDRWPAAIASLAPGVRLGQSQAELDILTKALQTDSAASYANAPAASFKSPCGGRFSEATGRQIGVDRSVPPSLVGTPPPFLPLTSVRPAESTIGPPLGRRRLDGEGARSPSVLERGLRFLVSSGICRADSR